MLVWTGRINVTHPNNSFQGIGQTDWRGLPYKDNLRYLIPHMTFQYRSFLGFSRCIVRSTVFLIVRAFVLQRTAVSSIFLNSGKLAEIMDEKYSWKETAFRMLCWLLVKRYDYLILEHSHKYTYLFVQESQIICWPQFGI